VDQALFEKYEENFPEIWKDLSWAITQIQKVCLGFTN